MHGNYLTLSRQALYDLVWSRPMTQVAAGFGISDVALAKRCAEVNVPVPPRGWWAKAHAGHDPPKTPLPKFRTRDGLAEEPVLRLPKRAPKPPPTERVPPPPLPAAPVVSSLDELLPSVKRAARHYKHPEGAQLTLEEGHERGPFPRLAVSAAQLERALRIADRLLRAAADRGWMLAPPAPPPPWQPRDPYAGRYGRPAEDPPPPPPAYGRLQVGTSYVEFRIEERTETLELPPSATDLTKQKRHSWFTPALRTDTRHLGLLRLVRSNPGYRYSITQRSWSDRASVRLEDKLPEVLEDFERTAAAMKARDEEIALEEARRAEQARIAEERRQWLATNAELAAELERQAGAWHYARRLRTYLRAARRSRTGDFRIKVGETSLDFLEWAERYVEEIDPLSTVPRHPYRTPARHDWWKPDDELVRTILARWHNRSHPLPLKLNAEPFVPDEWDGLDDD